MLRAAQSVTPIIVHPALGYGPSQLTETNVLIGSAATRIITYAHLKLSEWLRKRIQGRAEAAETADEETCVPDHQRTRRMIRKITDPVPGDEIFQNGHSASQEVCHSGRSEGPPEEA